MLEHVVVCGELPSGILHTRNLQMFSKATDIVSKSKTIYLEEFEMKSISEKAFFVSLTQTCCRGI